MVSLGLDGPNVNLPFQSKLSDEFSVIDVGTCTLHIVKSAFGKGVKSLRESVVDLDEMAIDLNTLLPGENNALLAMRQPELLQR